MSWFLAITLFAAVLPPDVQPAVEAAMQALADDLPPGSELGGVSIGAERIDVRLQIDGADAGFSLVRSAQPGRWFEAEGPPASQPWAASFLAALHAATPADPWVELPAEPPPAETLVREAGPTVARWRSRASACLWLAVVLLGFGVALRAPRPSGRMPP